DDHGGIVERGIRLRHRKCAKMKVREPAGVRSLAEWRKFGNPHDGLGLVRRADVRGNHAERSAGEHPRNVLCVLAGTRTNGAIPASSAAMQIWPQVSIEKLECSRST